MLHSHGYTKTEKRSTYKNCEILIKIVIVHILRTNIRPANIIQIKSNNRI